MRSMCGDFSFPVWILADSEEHWGVPLGNEQLAVTVPFHCSGEIKTNTQVQTVLCVLLHIPQTKTTTPR